MQPRFVGRLGLADAVTLANAGVGFLAAAAALSDPGLAARLLLLAAIADGLDGVIARVHGSTPVGEFLDSLADAVSFGLAPGLFVYGVARADWEVALEPTPRAALALGVAGLFVATAVVRLALFTAYDLGDHHTEGVQTTLAATLLAAAYLAGVESAAVVLGGTAVLCYLMVAPVTYPELYARDALAMGAVQTLAVLTPAALSRLFPRALLGAALAYLLFGPVLYWRGTEPATTGGPDCAAPAGEGQSEQKRS